MGNHKYFSLRNFLYELLDNSNEDLWGYRARKNLFEYPIKIMCGVDLYIFTNTLLSKLLVLKLKINSIKSDNTNKHFLS